MLNREGGRPQRQRAVRAGAELRLLHCEGSGKLDRARARLYRSQFLQENMRLKALAEIYTMHSFAQLCNLNFFCQEVPFVTFRLLNSTEFLKIKSSNF